MALSCGVKTARSQPRLVVVAALIETQEEIGIKVNSSLLPEQMRTARFMRVPGVVGEGARLRSAHTRNGASRNRERSARADFGGGVLESWNRRRIAAGKKSTQTGVA